MTKTTFRCYTYIGMQGGPQDLSLQANTACAHKGVAIHEILHAMGFYHEMTRRDRDQHIIIYYNNIYSGKFSHNNIFTHIRLSTTLTGLLLGATVG